MTGTVVREDLAGTSEEAALQPSLREDWRSWWRFERECEVGGGPVAHVFQIGRRWEVLRELVLRGLKSDYGDNFLGYGWTLFTPLVLIGIYTVVFSRVVNLGIQHYPLFVAAGMMPWVFFNAAVSQSMSALRRNSGVIRTVKMPREVFPLSVVGQNLFEYLLSLPIVFLLGFAFGVLPDRYVVFLPLSALIETVLLVGLALLLSSLATLVQDVPKLVRPALRVLFYLTPTVYPISRIHGPLLALYKFDPLVGVIELNRLAWYPSYQVTPGQVFQATLMSAAIAVVMFAIGWATFIRLEPTALKQL